MRRLIVPAVVTLVAFGVALALIRGDPKGRRIARVASSALGQRVPEPSVIPTERPACASSPSPTRSTSRGPWRSCPAAISSSPNARAGCGSFTKRGWHPGGIPPIDTRTQDGLMDLALHPRFAQNRTIYFTYSKPGERGDTTTLASARFEGGTVSAVRDLFVADAWSTAGGNSGSRIAFGLDGTIYMTVGERHEQTPAQDLRTHKGKILRLNDDGTVPPDNPFVGRADARPEIFAYGVRNPQGLFIEPSSRTIWEHEHGPRGGDELNVIVRGHNYGWPAITFGVNYNGTTISKDTARSGMDQPVVQWTPSISPSGLNIYSGDRFPAWRGDMFLGALSCQHLRRLVLRELGVTRRV